MNGGRKVNAKDQVETVIDRAEFCGALCYTRLHESSPAEHSLVSRKAEGAAVG
jgi:hypothetical protein